MDKIKTAIVGLGRLGHKHALDLIKTQNVELIAACRTNQSKLGSIKDWNIATYTDFETMLIEQPTIQAVIIASSSNMHEEHIKLAFKYKKHIFCEKPLSLTVQGCQEIVALCNANPDLIFQLGFMRRFDASYAQAKEMIENGKIGTPIMLKATSMDPLSAIDGFLKFAPTSGGIFFDLAIHDIDLAHWFLKANVTSVFASGDAYRFGQLNDYNDGDNVCAILNFDNGATAMLHQCRFSPHGYHIETEIIGTDAILRINSIPQKNKIQIFNNDGVLIECIHSFQERFSQAFETEKEIFFNCILDNKPSQCSAVDGLRAVLVSNALQESFIQKNLVKIKQL